MDPLISGQVWLQLFSKYTLWDTRIPWPEALHALCWLYVLTLAQRTQNDESDQVYISPTQARLYSQATAKGASGSGSGGCAFGPVDGTAPAVAPVFKTPMPDGSFRDEIVVEIISLW